MARKRARADQARSAGRTRRPRRRVRAHRAQGPAPQPAEARGRHRAVVHRLRRVASARRDERARGAAARPDRRRSRLPEQVQGLDDFDFSIRPQLEARVVRELLHCVWAAGGRNLGLNLVLVGRPGTGKTRVIDALCDAAIRLNYTVLKTMAADMLDDLRGAAAIGTYRCVFHRYLKPETLALDEFGYAFDVDQSGHLFRLISARHQIHGSIVVAANTGFTHWRHFFPSEAQSVATVDRLIDRATILRFSGKPCRAPKEIHGADPDAA